MVLVIGATGRTGREVALGLVTAGARVRALVRMSEKAADLSATGVEVVDGPSIKAEFARAHARAFGGAELKRASDPAPCGR
jgi:uncharacterized protein YbjT (DUF2867 family)